MVNVMTHVCDWTSREEDFAKLLKTVEGELEVENSVPSAQVISRPPTRTPGSSTTHSSATGE